MTKPDDRLVRWIQHCKELLEYEGAEIHSSDSGIQFALVRTVYCTSATQAEGVLLRTPWNEVLSCEEEGFKLAIRWLQNILNKGQP